MLTLLSNGCELKMSCALKAKNTEQREMESERERARSGSSFVFLSTRFQWKACNRKFHCFFLHFQFIHISPLSRAHTHVSLAHLRTLCVVRTLSHVVLCCVEIKFVLLHEMRFSRHAIVQVQYEIQYPLLLLPLQHVALYDRIA